MDGILKKPYEISVWEDNIITENNETYIEEKKLMVIGSDTMDSPNKVYEPVLTKNLSGEVKLTFSLQYKYFDPVSEKIVINPFSSFLINERKVKLYYDEEWYEFIIKSHSESSDGMKWTYDCVDAFVLELSKTGYNLEFSPEINNNQGTITELAEAVLKDTEWTVGPCNIGKQTVEEPIYYATLNTTDDITIENLGSGDMPESGDDIYVFYSYIANKKGKFLQFILPNNIQEIDDKGNYKATNYRIEEELIYDEENKQFKLDDAVIITIGELETLHHAYRLVYGQRTTYDPIMQRTVDIFKVGDTESDVDVEIGEAYRYKDYQYSTSDVVMSYITGGDKFEVLSSGLPQGWDELAAFTSKEDVGEGSATVHFPVKSTVITDPTLDKGVSFKNLAKYMGIEAFLQVKFEEVLKKPTGDSSIIPYRGAVFNSGINDNAPMIGSISKGQQYMLRWRGGEYIVPPNQETENENQSNENEPPIDLNKLKPFKVNEIGCIVAKYTKESQTDGEGRVYFTNQIDKDGIILQFEFNGNIEQPDTYTANNIMDSGHFVKEKEKLVRYVVDNVPTEPATNYIYIGKVWEYQEGSDEPTITSERTCVWNKNEGVYVDKSETSFLEYYYLTAPALQSITNAQLTDPTVDIGIFIYLRDEQNVSKYYNFADVQLTKYIEDANGKPVLIGNIPTAASIETSYYYMKPSDGTAAEDVETYTSLESFSEGIGIPVSKIVPEYNEDSEKVLSITESKSNCFNILQSIAETFEAWLKINVEHTDDGHIKLDDSGKPIKMVSFYEFSGVDNYAGFKYGINLQSIERTIDSDEIVTKLIVDSAQSEYTDEGIVSIQLGDANPSGESYILNFDYFYNNGLITDIAACKDDISEFYLSVKDLNNQLQELETQRRQLSMSLTKINSNRTVYSELIDEAKNDLNKARADFKEATGVDYEWYEEHDVSDDGNIYVKAEEYMSEFKDNVQYYKLVDLGYVKVSTPDPDEFAEGLYYVALQDVQSQDAIYEIIGRIYTDTAVINNYTALTVNTQIEYKKIRELLYGKPQYTFTATIVQKPTEGGVAQFVLQIYLNDYIDKFNFIVNSEEYKATPNKKTWDIDLQTSNFADITNIEVVDGYSIYEAGTKIEEDTIEISDAKVHKFTIKPNEAEPGVADQIKELQNTKNETTTDFFNKYSRFIQEGNWNSTDYIDSNLYYLDALQVSNNSSQPKVSYNISVVEISQLEGFENYNFDVGDKTYVEDEEFFGWNFEFDRPAREEVIVSEVEWHLDEPDNNSITVQNYKTQFEDLFQRLSATVQTVQYNEAAYTKTSSIVDRDGSLNQDLLVAALNDVRGRKFALTSDGSVYIDGDAIHIRNLTNSANRVIINSEGIQITNNGDIERTTIINGRGINIGEVFAGSINTDIITIGSNDKPSFRWDAMGISAYNKDGNGTYDLKTYVRYDQYGLYGIKNSANFNPSSLDDIKKEAHFAVTWDGFFIKNSYTGGGRVEITSDNDFRVLKIVGNEEKEKIKIGALEWGTKENPIYTPIPGEAPRLYGIRIRNNDGDQVFKTTDEGNIEITGKITATSGEIGGLVVDDDKLSMNHIVLEPGVGIYSNYASPYPFLISDTDGNATFNNITARGAIKTAVFEYAEIQAVGGIFLFRPSSTIKNAEISGSNDLKIRVEKPHLFKVDDWCKVSNYINQPGEPSAEGAQSGNGLTHVYRVSFVDSTDTRVLILEGAKKLIDDSIIDSANSLVGGSLVNMGHYENGKTSANYGIGVNSSDNTVNLPRRAISLFETTINPDPEKPVKVSYDYRGILGTLPSLSDMSGKVDEDIYTHLRERQGIYTDNMYIGDQDQYLAFYTENQQKKLKIKAGSIEFEDSTSLSGWSNIVDIEGISLIITSNKYEFESNSDNATLTAHVYKNGKEMTYTQITEELFYQINWYVGDSLIPTQTNSQTYTINSADSITIIAKLEDILN